jgi:hypothetical protein
MFTVVPSIRSSVKVSPAGTVNELIVTVVHSTALATSLIDEIVPAHSVERGEGAGRATARVARTSNIW